MNLLFIFTYSIIYYLSIYKNAVYLLLLKTLDKRIFSINNRCEKDVLYIYSISNKYIDIL